MRKSVTQREQEEELTKHRKIFVVVQTILGGKQRDGDDNDENKHNKQQKKNLQQ